MELIRIPVHAKPGSRRAGVGGARGDALVVAVNERAVEGAANEAIVAAVAKALGVRTREVSLDKGVTSRSKVLRVAVADERAAEEVRRRVEELRSG